MERIRGGTNCCLSREEILKDQIQPPVMSQPFLNLIMPPEADSLRKMAALAGTRWWPGLARQLQKVDPAR